MAAKIYEGTRGFVIDVPIRGIESLSGIQHAHLYVMAPGCTEPQVWPVTLEAELGVLRHVVPDDAPLVAGRYLIQPVFRSLMPKGVEHFHNKINTLNTQSVPIFDAERR